MKKRAMSRSENMAKIKNKDTKPEMLVRRLLYNKGYRYRLHSKDLPGKPDLYISKYNTAVFVNGCFWHAHKGCKKFTIPKTNRDFWEDKLLKNRERDKINYARLIESGYNVIVVWECSIESISKNEQGNEQLLSLLVKAIKNSTKMNVI